MKTKTFAPSFAGLLFLVLTSCLTVTDPAQAYAKWKTDNEMYVTGLKDSAGYVVYNIPANRGGGVIYSKICKEGTSSVNPALSDTVKVNYRGRLINGKVFDETYSSVNPTTDTDAAPVSFRVDRVVAGFREALLQMKVGEWRTVVIPQDLAYGAAGAGGVVPPYSVLIFDIQLISIGSSTTLPL